MKTISQFPRHKFYLGKYKTSSQFLSFLNTEMRKLKSFFMNNRNAFIHTVNNMAPDSLGMQGTRALGTRVSTNRVGCQTGCFLQGQHLDRKWLVVGRQFPVFLLWVVVWRRKWRHSKWETEPEVPPSTTGALKTPSLLLLLIHVCNRIFENIRKFQTIEITKTYVQINGSVCHLHLAQNRR